MPKIEYVWKQFRAPARDIIHKANLIIDEYQKQGFILTLRQLYYQFVSRDWLPNTQREYGRLGEIVADARLAGMIDWDAIEDRTRNLQKRPTWESPADIINSCAYQYAIDKWADQPYRLEVWIEKEALAGVFERVCRQFQVPFFCCRGYTSLSEMHVAAERLIAIKQGGQMPIILHFGDHDPSGIDMTRDIVDRLATFRMPLEVSRLALNMDQIEEHKPPPNPVKMTDSRAENAKGTGYVDIYGDESWELDALEPKLLAALVETAVKTYRDEAKWLDSEDRERGQAQQLIEVSKNWIDVPGLVRENNARRAREKENPPQNAE